MPRPTSSLAILTSPSLRRPTSTPREKRAGDTRLIRRARCRLGELSRGTRAAASDGQCRGRRHDMGARAEGGWARTQENRPRMCRRQPDPTSTSRTLQDHYHDLFAQATSRTDTPHHWRRGQRRHGMRGYESDFLPPLPSSHVREAAGQSLSKRSDSVARLRSWPRR